MKNVVLLSPHFPTNFKTFAVALKNIGANTLGLDDEPHAQIHQTLKDSLSEYYRVNNLHNYDELAKGIEFFIHKYGKISVLDSHSEYWLETEAKLRDDFNIPGLRNKDMRFIRCKSEMKKIYQSIGLRVAKGRIVNSLKEAKVFCKEIGYPVVVKPDAGVGAANTHKIQNNAELEDVFSRISNIPYIIEEFINGTIHSFDGLADQNSNPLFCTSHVFNKGVMDIVNEDSNIYYHSVLDIPKALEDAGKKCLKAFGVKERFFHLEFFHTPKGELIPLEVNMRPPGGLTIDMFNYACDTDVFKAWADLVVNGNNKLDYNRKYHCAYIGRKNDKSYANSHDDVLKKFDDYTVLHKEMPAIYRGALGDYAYIARAEELAKIVEMAHYIQKIC